MVTLISRHMYGKKSLIKGFNGTDFDDDLVKDEIPLMYTLIEDKVLYQPKFITSGGYTDSIVDIEQAKELEAIISY